MAIVCRSISKGYYKIAPLVGTRIEALREISFEVRRGEVFGVIGPDGAGKSTLFKILATLLSPDSGCASIEGLDVTKDYRRLRSHIGYMPGRFSLYQDLTVQENLNLFARVFNTTIEENLYLIEEIYQQLAPFKRRRAEALSGGMKQKLALCCSLIHKPKVLILDEPTTGVDPVSRKEFWETISRLQGEGITTILSTPYMDEAASCDRIALIKGGKFLKVDTPTKIVSQYRHTLLGVRGENQYALLADLRCHSSVKSCFPFGDKLHVTLKGNKLEGEVLKRAELSLKRYLSEERGHNLVSVESITPGVEDSFMDLTLQMDG